MYSDWNCDLGVFGFGVLHKGSRAMKQLFLSIIFAIFFGSQSFADWVAGSETDIPAQAFIAVNNEGGQLFHICRASIGENALPGKLESSSGECLISSEGRVYRARKFDVLVGENFNWIEQYNGDVPFDALPTGREKDGKVIYSCRGEINSTRHPGKIRRDSRGCHVPYNGREMKALWYEVLIGQ